MSSLNTRNGTPIWRSLNELAATPEFEAALAKEFPNAIMGEDEVDGLGRRRFMQLMGASFALATGAGCRWQKENILPFDKRPHDRIPGNAQYFASAFELAGCAQPVMVTVNDGRPTKIGPNKEHPGGVSGTNVFVEASILEMYDPDRLAAARESAKGTNYRRSLAEVESMLASMRDAMAENQGDGAAVLTELFSGPTFARLRAALQKQFPKLRWFHSEPVNRRSVIKGCETAFGKQVRPHFKYDKAKVIVSLDDDFLGTHPDAVTHAAGYGKNRRPEAGKMNRLYVVESKFSTTGSVAEHRLGVRGQDVLALTQALEMAIRSDAGLNLDARTKRALGPAQAPTIRDRKVSSFVEAMAQDLVSHQGHALVTAGWQQPPLVHALVARINRMLKSEGHTLDYVDASDEAGMGSLAEFAADMDAGRLHTAMILGGNPAYASAASLGIGDKLRKLKHSAHLSLYANETSEAVHWALPRAHVWEAWGDVRTEDGRVGLQQPMIAPLYDGLSHLEVLSRLLDGPKKDGYALVRETYMANAFASDLGLKRAIRDGHVDGSGRASAQLALANFQVDRSLEVPPRKAGGKVELQFVVDASVFDGRYANSGWLQETPDFMTKLTWDNAALISPETAEALGVKNGTWVDISAGGQRLKAPAYVLPGQPTNVVGIQIGYGREEAGVVGGLKGEVAPVGVNAYTLMTEAEGFQEATLTATGEAYAFAATQSHHMIDTAGMEAREHRMGELVRSTTYKEWKKHPDDAKHVVHHPPLKSLFTDHKYEGHRWGMAIDLAACVGCNACTVACQAENNIPIVGKDQVMRGREMHWIRIDRYFVGEDPETPEVAIQPLTCQQCENAPCEQVCPVAATVHTDEGLNDMVYNRCIGTRYCSNNCPYKVRRFNYFNYNYPMMSESRLKVTQMKNNPQVTIRSRGVMEKCTYCVQRIQDVKIKAKNAKRPIEDGEWTTACEDACPTNSIVVGDLADPESQVSRLQGLDRSYALLAELNVRPRTQYLAHVSNPNPKLGHKAS